jgi:hypothetical protein
VRNYIAMLNWIFGDADMLLKYFAGSWFRDSIVGRGLEAIFEEP